MVLCFVALFVFAVLGIFSAKYRVLAKEALDCVARTVTLRPCESKLDERLHAKIVAKLLPIFPAGARTLHKHFQIFSILLVVLFFGSLLYSGVSVFNYWAFGNCNGPDSSEFCVFDAVLGKQPGAASALLPIAPGIGPVLGNGSTVMVEVGCFTCPFTKKTQPELQAFLAHHPEISLEWRALPIPAHDNSDWAAKAGFCADEQGRFWPMHDALFAAQPDHSRENLVSIAQAQGLNVSGFQECLDSPATQKRLDADVAAGKAAGIYGTPTFFLGNVSLVGPQTLADFEAALRGEQSVQPGVSGGACPPPEGV